MDGAMTAPERKEHMGMGFNEMRADGRCVLQRINGTEVNETVWFRKHRNPKLINIRQGYQWVTVPMEDVKMVDMVAIR